MAVIHPPQPHDGSCIFCKIVAGQIPAHKVYEDDVVFAFLDIGPLTHGHCLVIPKGHYRNILDIPPQVIAEVSSRLPKMARAVLVATGAPACHVLLNNGAEAQQSVLHLHYHIIPRATGDGFMIPWNAGKLDNKQATELGAKITGNLALEGGTVP